jgi:hypothetical protein
MTISRLSLILAGVVIVGLASGCTGKKPVTLDEALSFYRENKLEQALPIFEQLVAEDAANWQKQVWLAETYRRLGKKGEAVKAARRAIDLNPNSSFAHTVLAEASNPVLGEWSEANSDTTWFHLMKAIECDSSDGHPWLVIWGEAVHRGEYPLMGKALRRLVESGFLTKAALAYGRWMLRGLPKDAILLTNGDMDTYPPGAVQELEGFRKDVAIVNRGALNEQWYARFIRDNAKVPLPFDDASLDRLESFKDSSGNIIKPSDQIFRAWLEQKSKGVLKRPLAVAITVEESYYSTARDNMRYAGAFLIWTPGTGESTPDITALLAALEGVKPEDFSGPWVSEQDRSPIRRLFTKNIVQNVTRSAIVSGEMLLEKGRSADAQRWANWADQLDKTAELGPVFAERIGQLQSRVAKAQK